MLCSYRRKEYGDVFKIQMLDEIIVVTTNKEAVKVQTFD
jgi:hypothetical protein